MLGYTVSVMVTNGDADGFATLDDVIQALEDFGIVVHAGKISLGGDTITEYINNFGMEE
jgi:hypothetical protein